MFMSDFRPENTVTSCHALTQIGPETPKGNHALLLLLDSVLGELHRQNVYDKEPKFEFIWKKTHFSGNKE